MELKDCKVGMKVMFGRGAGEQTLGEIIKVNGVNCKVKQLEVRGSMRSYSVGTVWTVPASLMTPVVVPTVPAKPKRTNAEIMGDIASCYGQLSPENLHCDGEISRSAAMRKAVAIKARLADLFKEIGRKVSEDEAYGMPVSTFRFPAKACAFKTGDKVCFKAKDGTTVTGYVRTSNTKSVTVDPIGATNGKYWRVDPSMLRAA